MAREVGTGAFNSVDFRMVFLPLLTKSMSSLSQRSSLTCPTPKVECSIQSCAFQFNFAPVDRTD